METRMESAILMHHWMLLLGIGMKQNILQIFLQAFPKATWIPR